ELEEDLRLPQKVERRSRRRSKEEQLKRLHRAQVIQTWSDVLVQTWSGSGLMFWSVVPDGPEEHTQTDDPEDWNQELVAHLRGCPPAEVSITVVERQDLQPAAGLCAGLDPPALMQYWFRLAQQKNALLQRESSCCRSLRRHHSQVLLSFSARELELEDQQRSLQQELRGRMTVDAPLVTSADRLKDEGQLLEERLILEEMLEVVEQRDALVSLLEAPTEQERQE
ncbi:unnamed protein product, partial [Tetraodon nigroviridis]